MVPGATQGHDAPASPADLERVDVVDGVLGLAHGVAHHGVPCSINGNANT